MGYACRKALFGSAADEDEEGREDQDVEPGDRKKDTAVGFREEARQMQLKSVDS